MYFCRVRRVFSATVLLMFGLTLSCLGQQGVTMLRPILLNKTLRVRIQGLHCSRNPVFTKVDIRIINGVIQKRMFDQMTTNASDEVLNPGDSIRVVAIETNSDNKKDYLRFTIAAADGPTVPVAFVFNKGELTTKDVASLEQAVDMVFELPPPQAAPVQPSPQAQPAPPPANLPMPPADLPMPPADPSSPPRPH